MGKNIYVTQDVQGRDKRDCGPQTSPCKTIKHAIDMSTPFDTILLDGGKENHYKYLLNETVLIDKELTLTSIKFQHIPKITMKINLQRQNPLAFFSITKNFTLRAVDVYVDTNEYFSCEIYLFTIQTNKTSVTLSDSYLRYIYPLFDLLADTEITVHMENCIIENSSNFYVNSISFHSFEKTTDTNMISNRNVLIKVNQCHFVRSWVNVCLQKICDVQFKRTNFTKSILSITPPTKAMLFQTQKYFLKCKLILQNVNFKGTMISGGIIDNFQVNIKDCDVIIQNCKFDHPSTGVLNVYRSKIDIKNSIFINNYQSDLSKQTGLLQFYGSRTTISDCHFKNNSVPTAQGGILKFERISESTPHLSIRDTSIKSGICSQCFENSLVSIQAENEPFIANITLSCPVNNDLIFTYGIILEYKSFFALCRSCGSDNYSIVSASMSWNLSKQAFNDPTVTCAPCPFGATCEQGIKSKGNYWGYKTKNNYVKFLYCPTLYCCTSPSSCLSYNTCHQYRHNRLCGECIEGYSTGLFGQSECIQNSSCNNYYFWIFYILLIGFYIIFFMYLQEIIFFIKRIIQKIICYHKILSNDATEYEEIVEKDQLLSDDNSDLPFQLLTTDSANSIEYPEKSVKISGFIKIIFFFYQTASIVRINSSTKAQYHFPEIADILLSFHNIRIDISSTYLLQICPIKNNGTISVEIVRSGIMILCPLILLFKILLYRVCKNGVSRICHSQKMTKNKANFKQYTTIDENAPYYGNLPFIVRVKIAYIQLLLIGFASLAVLLFKMINCVEIQGHKYLYMQATVPCYTVWQIFAMVFIAIWVAPFWFSIYFSCSLLRTCKVTPNEYLFITTFPLSVSYYLLRARFYNGHTSLIAKDAILAREFLRVVNEPFRNISYRSIKIQWESVLIFRRLLLIVVSTFLISPLDKLYPLGFLLVLYLIHHMIVQPYKESILNLAEGISLAVLCFLTLLNTFWAFADEIDITKNSILMMTGKVFIYFELVLLLIPILAIFGLSFFLLFRKCVCKRKKF